MDDLNLPSDPERIFQMVDQMYQTQDPELRKHVHDALFQLQKQNYAWQLAPNLLAAQSVNCQFFGAHTLQIKIARDWSSLPADQVPWLRELLLESIVQFSNGPDFVATKLCLALTTLALNATPDSWPNFIPSYFEHLQKAREAGRNVDGVLLEFLTVLPEEVLRSSLGGGRKARIHQELLDATPVVLNTLKSYMGGPSAEGSSKALRCLQSWVQFGIPFEQIHPLMNNIIQLLSSPLTFDTAVEVLIEIVGHPTNASYQDTMFEGLLSCVTGDFMFGEFRKSIEEIDESSARSIAMLLASIGEAYTTHIARGLPRPDVTRFLEMMIAYTGYPGCFGADQEISDIPLHFWAYFQETLCDPDVLPPPVPFNDGSEEDLRTVESVEALATANLNRKQATPEEAALIREAAKPVFSNLVEVLRKGIEYPPGDGMSSWNNDVRDRFKMYRRDVGDTLINAYYILREKMLEQLVDFAAARLAGGAIEQERWQSIEATLFAIRSVSEAVPPTENSQIERVFGGDVFGVIAEWNSSPMLKYTALLLVGVYADWLKHHHAFLEPALNYLVPCLANPVLAPAAATGLKNVCDVCRDQLVHAITALVGMYVTYGGNIQPREKQKLLESISDVIQALPPSNMIEPLSALVGDTLKTLEIALGTGAGMAVKETIVNQFQYLTSCCRGVQFPGDEDITKHLGLTDERDKEKEQELQQVRYTQAQPIIAAIWEGVLKTTNQWYHDTDVMEAICCFLETGLRTASHILSIPIGDLLAYLVATLEKEPNHSCLLDVAAQSVTLYGENREAMELFRDLLTGTANVVLSRITSISTMDQNPDVVSSFFSLLTRYFRKCPAAIYHLPKDVFGACLMFAMNGLSLQDRLALKSSLMFMVEFIGQDSGSTELSNLVEEVVRQVGGQIVQELLAGIGGRHPRSFVPLLADVLYRLVCKRIEQSRQWLAMSLNQEGFPSKHVNEQMKKDFARDILRTRNIRRFKTTVQEFSLKCRNL